MPEINYLGKLLIVAGVIIVIAGIILTFIHKLPFPGKLPGDIYIRRGNFTFYFPFVTCILISIFLSLLLWFLSKR